MTDAEFVRRFETRQIPDSRFHHRDHLRIAWWYLRSSSIDAAIRAVQSQIRSFAQEHAHAYKYHATLTELWVRLIAAHLHEPGYPTFGDFIDENGALLDKKLPLRFYSPDTLYSEKARSGWVGPDLRALPIPCRNGDR